MPIRTEKPREQVRIRFGERETFEAYETWGCNCGPAALAAALGMTPDEVRPTFEAIGFPEKRYTSPTMMLSAIRRLGVSLTERPVKHSGLMPCAALPQRGVARIQWRGPWMDPKVNPKWRYWHTHWIAAWKAPGANMAQALYNSIHAVVFDVNGGLMRYGEWERGIVPAITKTIPRADGGFEVTHSWELEAA